LCVPARLAFTSGKYSSRVGAWNNQCWLPSADYPSLPRVLAAAGYDPCLCGKMHYDNTCRYGFTEIGGNFNENHMDGLGFRLSANATGPNGRLSSRFSKNELKVAPDGGNMGHDRRVTKGTVNFIENRRAGDKPFFLAAGYLCPHFPLIAPQAMYDHFKGKVPMPKIPDKFLDSLAPNYKVLRAAMEYQNVPEDLVRYGREVYCALTEWMDAQVGQVLAALAKSPFAGNTIVIYTSDHGENMGEHGLWWKNAMFEQAARIPLIVSYPSRWKGGQRRKGACSLVDLVQTVAQAGGATAPADWNGASMIDWLDNPHGKWRDQALSEYYGHNIASGYTMLRQGRYKYVYHAPADAKHPAFRELYDMESDPGEFENLSQEAKHKDLIVAMHQELVKEVGADPDKTELRCRADYAKGYARNAVHAALFNGFPERIVGRSGVTSC
jgi:choline-sulfatase